MERRVEWEIRNRKQGRKEKYKSNERCKDALSDEIKERNQKIQQVKLINHRKRERLAFIYG